MTDTTPDSTQEEAPPPYRLEKARSGRSKCKTCRKTIDKDALRLGVLIEGPFGTGYIWHHLTCAAKRNYDAVEAVYADRKQLEGLEPPPISELSSLREAAEKKRAEKQTPPYVERASTGRSKCAHCGEPIAEAAFRVCVLRSVEFYGQVRNGPIKVHAACVRAALREPNSATEAEGFAELLREQSRIPEPDIEAALEEIGELESE